MRLGLHLGSLNLWELSPTLTMRSLPDSNSEICFLSMRFQRTISSRQSILLIIILFAGMAVPSFKQNGYVGFDGIKGLQVGGSDLEAQKWPKGNSNTSLFLGNTSRYASKSSRQAFTTIQQISFLPHLLPTIIILLFPASLKPHAQQPKKIRPHLSPVSTPVHPNRGQFLYINKVMMLQYSQKVIGQARKTRGYLEKRSSGLLSIWQKRYFILIEDTVSYYADETLEQVKKSIPIQEIKNIKIVDQVEFQLVTKKRIYELRADDRATRDLWVASINLLINYKEWNQASTERALTANPKKEVSTKRQSRNKKMTSRASSPPQLVKTSSTASRWRSLESDFTAQGFFSFICLPKLAEQWSKQSIKSKTLLLKESKGCYFIISCKTLLFPHEDRDFLGQDLVYPYDFNSLYYFQFGKMHSPEVIEICKCSEFKDVEAEPGCIKILLEGRVVTIKVEQKRMEVLDIQTLIKKLKSAAAIGKEYHNPQKLKIRRNIDSLFYKYETKQLKIAEIAANQFQSCLLENKDHIKHEFKKNLEDLKKNLREILNCCEVKEQASGFRDEFVKEYHERVYQYVQKSWANLSKSLTSFEIKKIVLLLHDFWRVSKDCLKDDRMFVASIAILKVLIERYQEEIISKVNSCFLLSEKELLDEVNIEIKSQNEVISKMDTVFLSNSVYRQFHLDIRLVLYEFSEMPVHEKALQYYLILFRNCFKHITQQTFKCLDKWKDALLILGTCNQIQFIKNSLFQEMFDKLTKEYKGMSTKIKKENLKELEGEINNVEIMLVKKLFVLTFSDIDRNLLNKSYDELAIGAICTQIMEKLKAFSKVNRYVKRNIFQASFQEICYFYYTSIIKFNKHKKEGQNSKEFASDFFLKKIGEDIKVIGQCFQSSIHNQKIYAHLKDLSLIKEFIQCDLAQIKKVCRNLKKEFGNSFTEAAVKNLLSLRQMNGQLKQDLVNECSQIVKNSADTPEQISLISSSRESFLQNWNNTRSRKSTLTLSLNEFYENQHAIHTSKSNCSRYKQGYLFRKRITKEMKSIEVKCFFKIKNGELVQYEDNTYEAEPLNIYDLQNIKKCSLHSEKGYIFFAEFADVKLQLKAETSDEAKEWVRNIYEEISSLSVVKDHSPEKERTTEVMLSLQKETKDQSTMDSYQKNLKEKSLERSNGSSPKTFKKGKKQEGKTTDSPDKTAKLIQKQKPTPEDNCLKCSKGFFF